MQEDFSQDASKETSQEAPPETPGEGAITDFCATCPNWIEIEFQSRVPGNMPNYVAIAGLCASDIPLAEAGMPYIITDVEQEVFEKRGRIGANGFARIDLPSNIPEVQFAFGSERPEDILNVPEGEQVGDRASDEHWAIDIGRGALTGLENGVNQFMRAMDDFGFWIGWNPGAIKVDGKWVWMNTQERKEFFETYGYVDTLDFGLDRPGGKAGQITEGIAQFLVGFIPAIRAARMVGVTRVVGQSGTYVVAGAIADATVFDPHEQRLANLVQEYPRLRNPISQYLSSDPNDSAAEGRLKNALEGLVFGAVLDRFVVGLRAMRAGINRMVIQLKTQYKYIFDTETLDSVIFVLLRAARNVEPPITQLLQPLSARFNGRMVGLEFRFKTEESLARKISGDAVGKGKYYSEIAENIKDVLRYTTVFPDDTYTSGVTAMREALVEQGYKEVKFANTWGEEGYKGINAAYKTADGFTFELQFHTNASHHAKEGGTHSLYEEWRVLDKNSVEAKSLRKQMNLIFNQVPIPPGSLNLN